MEKRIQDIRDKLARAVRAQRVCMFVQDSKAALTSDEEKWITTKKGEKGGGGRRFLIDTETGVILKGGPKKMRGKTFAQAFESKQQKKERYAANRAAKKEQYAATRKKTNEKGRKLVQKLIDKKYLAPGKAAQELKKTLTQRDVKRLTSILKDGQRFVKNQKQRDKRAAEKAAKTVAAQSKSKGKGKGKTQTTPPLIRQIEGR